MLARVLAEDDLDSGELHTFCSYDFPLKETLTHPLLIRMGMAPSTVPTRPSKEESIVAVGLLPKSICSFVAG